ncbi:MAG: hypothetical protein ACOC44_04475 [Promethearchaeia archaeon]
MVHKSKNDQEEKKKEKKKELSDLFESSQEKKGEVAKEKVKLKHVEVQKQKMSPDAADLAKSLKEQMLTHDHFERLSNDEITVLETFMNRRLFLSRIAIIANQSRIPLGIEPFKKADLEKILENLMDKGYVESETMGDKEVYFLTERGKYRVQ